MLIGFIAVVVILLIVIGLMSTGVLQTQDSGKYAAEAKKVQALISTINTESQFYYPKQETFAGLNTDYLANSGVAEQNIVNDTMNSDEWIGWPANLTSPYNGKSIKLGGIAGDDIRILVLPLNQGKDYGIYILKRKNTTVDPKFLAILEKTLAQDESYIGG